MASDAAIREALIRCARTLGGLPWRQLQGDDRTACANAIREEWRKSLHDCSDADVVRGSEQWIRDNKWWPTPRDIRSSCIRQAHHANARVMDSVCVTDEPAILQAHRLPHRLKLLMADEYGAGPADETPAQTWDRMNDWVRRRLNDMIEEEG